jgi:hypothetical protein
VKKNIANGINNASNKGSIGRFLILLNPVSAPVKKE